MRGLRLGMRWWLALAFASIVALTSLVVAGNALHSTSQSLRGHAQDLAIGNSLRASVELADAVDKGNLNQAIKSVATARRLSLFAFDRNGSPVTGLRSRGVRLQDIPSRLVAVSTAIAGKRYIHSANDGSATLVALPMQRHGVAAVIAYSPRPDVATELDIVKRSIVESALLAVAIGAAAGIVVAILIVRRLRRISAAARAIADGDFAVQLKPQWRDELGELAATIDLMRQRLHESFDRMASEHHRLEGLLERLYEGVVLVDRDLSIGYANGAARRILGVDTLTPGGRSQSGSSGAARSRSRRGRRRTPITPTASSGSRSSPASTRPCWC
jgi:HAMP domain-containing protein